MFVALVVLAATFPLAACDNNACGHPSKATYSSPPGAPGSTGCKGFSVDGGGSASEVDETFPVGTVVRLPRCLGAYPDEVMTCTCSALPTSTSTGWICPV
jgi:hypothetical protein